MPMKDAELLSINMEWYDVPVCVHMRATRYHPNDDSCPLLLSCTA